MEAHGMYHMLLSNYCSMSKDDIKAELCIVLCSIMNIKHMVLDIDLYFCENIAHIQGHMPLGPHTIDISQKPDLTIPRAYN